MEPSAIEDKAPVMTPQPDWLLIEPPTEEIPAAPNDASAVHERGAPTQESEPESEPVGTPAPEPEPEPLPAPAIQTLERWQDVARSRTWRDMRRMRELVELVVTGKKPMQMFCSEPGLGKSETVLQVMSRHRMQPHYSSPGTVHGLCADLWKYKNSVYFLNDCDVLARQEGLINIAKQAWGPHRVVTVPTSLRISRNEAKRLVF